MTEVVSKIEKFSGLRQDWPLWSELFLAKMEAKDLSWILDHDPSKIPEVSDTNSSEDKELIKANVKVYSELISSMDMKKSAGRIAMNLVVASKSVKNPRGNAPKAWKDLKRKYAPNTAAELGRIKQEYVNARMGTRQDPETFLDYLERKRTRLIEMGHTIDDKEFLLDISNKLPKDYELIIEKINDMLDDESMDAVDMLELTRDRLRAKFARLNKGRSYGREPTDGDEDEEGEHALYAGRQVKKKCTKCGVWGHKPAQCEDFQNRRCFICHKSGHISRHCPNKKNNKKNNNSNNCSNNDEYEKADVVLVGTEVVNIGKEEAEDIYLGDTGASSHMVKNEIGVFDVKKVEIPVQMGNGKKVICHKMGKKKLTVIPKDGEEFTITLEDVLIIPELWINLFSIGKALERDWQLSNKGKCLVLSKGKVKLLFDHIMQTPRSSIAGFKAKTYLEDAQVNLEEGKTYPAEEIHKALGHANVQICKETAAYYGWKYSGEFSTCENCANAKGKQKQLSKESSTKASAPGERLCLDISTIHNPSYGGSKHWLLVLDDYSDYCWSFFLKTKDEASERIQHLVNELKCKHKIEVKKIRCDNAGENKLLEKESKNNKLYLDFEWTAPGTPQQNGKVERKFATLFGYTRSVLNDAGMTKNMRKGLWTEAAAAVTFVHNLTVKNKCTPYQKFFKTRPDQRIVLRKFGELGSVTFRKGTIRPKTENKGRTCMFLGYASKSPTDTFRMWDLNTQRVIISRDIIWLNKFYGDWRWKGLDENDDEETVEMEVEEQTKVEMKGPLPSEVEKLRSSFNEPSTIDITTGITTRSRALQSPRTMEMERVSESDSDAIANLVQEEMQGIMDFSEDETLPYDIAMFLMEDQESLFVNKEEKEKNKDIDKHNLNPVSYADEFTVPESYGEAWDHSDPFQRMKWREAIQKELKKMEDCEVWEIIDEKEKPPDRRCVKHKWIFNIKRNGTFRARLVACGYSQIPGVDFTENYAPVVQDVTWRIVMVLGMLLKLKFTILDVETAFLHGNLEEEIYMECPNGLDHKPGEVLRLKKSIYGLVQAARQFYKRWKEVLNNIGFKESKADPCLFTKKGPVYLGTYVDDNFIANKPEVVDEIIKGINDNGLKVTKEDSLGDYLSCNIVFNKEKTRAWIGQPGMIKKLEKKFGERVKHLREFHTPGTPGQGLFKAEKDDPGLSPEDQTVYRSGVGMLLYLVKHSRPDIANATRELSKGMQKATKGAWKELLRVIKFVLDTRLYGLKIDPVMVNGKWIIIVYCDADWAGDRQNRISISGFILFFCGVPVLWRSRAQRNITLSTGESEYVSLSDASKEVKFIYMLLESMGVKVQLPIIVRIDNIAAMFMAETANASSRTRHVDVRYHFVQEFVEDGFIKIEFVTTDKNLADMFTKNVKHNIYKNHHDLFVDDRRECL